MKDNEKTLRIVELNLECGKKNKFSDQINRLLDGNELNVVKPDILVLTECGKITEAEYQRALDKYECKWGFRNQIGYNAICVFIWDDKIKEVEHITDSKDNTEEIKNDEPSPAEIYPNSVLIKITLKDDTECIVDGIRFVTSWSSVKRYENVAKYCKIVQNAHFIDSIKSKKPDIIIGDYNVDSEMVERKPYNSKTIAKIIKEFEKSKYEKYKDTWKKSIEKQREYLGTQQEEFDFEKVLCKILGEEYHSWPDENEEVGYCTKEITRPDRIIYNKSKVELKKAFYYPKLKKEQQPNAVIYGWPSDHSMIIADVELKG